MFNVAKIWFNAKSVIAKSNLVVLRKAKMPKVDANTVFYGVVVALVLIVFLLPIFDNSKAIAKSKIYGPSIDIVMAESNNLIPVAMPITTVADIMEVKPYCENVKDCISDIGKEFGATDRDIQVMQKIAKCESTYRADAKNKYSTASGVYQIIRGTWNSNSCQGDVFNAQSNITCGWNLYFSRGTNPWNSSRACWGK